MADSNLPDDFISALRSLFDWLEAEHVPAASIGGIAVSLLAQPRATQDIDAVIWLEESRWLGFVEAGAKHGIIPRISDAVEFVRRARVLLLKHEPSGISIDLSIGGLEFERELIERALTLDLGEVTIKVPTPEDLIITKAVARRPKDLADIDALVSTQPQLDVQRIRFWVNQFAEVLEMPELAENVEKILRYYATPKTPAPSRGQAKNKAKRKKSK